MERSGLATLLEEAREAAGLSLAELARRVEITPQFAGRIERGERAANFDTVDRWLQECGARLAIVPPDVAAPAELTMLPEDLQDLLLRLARLLPRLPPILLRDLRGRVESWREDYGSDAESSATSQDSRASAT